MKASSIEDIDTMMKLGMAHPMGPLQLADYIGLDVCLAIMNVLHDGFGDSKYRPCPLLRQYVAAGWLGKKPGAASTTIAPPSTAPRRSRRRRDRDGRVLGVRAEDDQRAVAELAAESPARDRAAYRAGIASTRFRASSSASSTTRASWACSSLKRYGGGDTATSRTQLAIEELARVDAGTAVTVSVHSMICDRRSTSWVPTAQKDRWLPELAQEAYLGVFALTEPDVGSDAANLRATAQPTATVTC